MVLKRFVVILGIGLVGAAVGCSGTAETSEEVDPASVPATSLIQLAVQLDDPQHYCIDIWGFGFEVRLNDPLQTHTCKRTQFEDELFNYGQPSDGQLYMEEYRVCMEAGAAESGASLYVRRCTDSSLQRFGYMTDQTLRLLEGDGALCVAIAAGEGQSAGGDYLRRDLSLQACAQAEPSLIEWAFPGLSVE